MYKSIQEFFYVTAGLLVISIVAVIGLIRLVIAFCIAMLLMLIYAVAALCIGVCSVVAYPFVQLNKWWKS